MAQIDFSAIMFV